MTKTTSTSFEKTNNDLLDEEFNPRKPSAYGWEPLEYRDFWVEEDDDDGFYDDDGVFHPWGEDDPFDPDWDTGEPEEETQW